ncbi:hypothetical protein DRA43_02395 [Micromonospora provocatoris]|nr:hypothetical protein [Micromonospora provocatoris]RBJ10484.1 hypothetical protein DRA43_02395 [Micromonospora provocatoris]
MDTPRRCEHASYLAPELRDLGIAPEQLLAGPCSRYGTVYLHKGRDLHRRVVWVAAWVDEINGHTAGIDRIEGTRETVLAWARSRPAAAHLMPAADGPGWVPLPDTDDEIDLPPLTD